MCWQGLWARVRARGGMPGMSQLASEARSSRAVGCAATRTPVPRTHLEIARSAFALGKPVFCEKPLGASLAESRELASLAQDAGVANMVGFNYVRCPATQ